VAKPRARRIGLPAAALIAIVGGWFFVGQIFAKDLIAWVPYSKATVEQLLKEGKPVFIDFTADWCLSCKFNERTAIDTAAVRQKIAAQGIVPVKADATKENPEINAALKHFGRVGVPFYVLYPAGQPDHPITLPELLTESIVLDAFAKAR
jgi:thiol:disulfide interchange protein DsbD